MSYQRIIIIRKTILTEFNGITNKKTIEKIEKILKSRASSLSFYTRNENWYGKHK